MPSPVVCLSSEEQMARALAAEQPAALQQLGEHVAVADPDVRTNVDAETSAEPARCRGYVISVPTTPGTGQALGEAIGGEHVEELVAVEEASVGVDDLDAVAVAVERDAVVGAADFTALNSAAARRAEAGVDVVAVGPAADVDRPRRRARGRHRERRGTPRRGRRPPRSRGPQREVLLYVLLQTRRNARASSSRRARPSWFEPPRRQLPVRRLDVLSHPSGSLSPRAEELDAVVLNGLCEALMTAPSRPGARVRLATAGVGNGPVSTRRRPRHEPGLERRLDHVARHAGVLADDDAVPVVAALVSAPTAWPRRSMNRA